MTRLQTLPNRRILVVDDNAAIHEDFRKVLCGAPQTQTLDALEESLFGECSSPKPTAGFELTCADQGQTALTRVKEAVAAGTPFATAFIDIRMPPGWDGVETAARLWEADPHLQVVICTAFSDYSWDQMRHRLGLSDRLLILKKPFDPIEVLQLAHALNAKWDLLIASENHRADLELAVAERTWELSSSNRQLIEEMTRRQSAEAQLLQAKKLEALGRLAGGMAHEINNPLSFVLSNLAYINEEIRELISPAELSEDLSQATSDAIHGAERISRIIRNVKAFADAEGAPSSQMDLETLIEDAAQVARSGLQERGTLRVDLSQLEKKVMGETAVTQVLINLLTNAVQALPPNAAARNEVRLSAGSREGSIWLEVSDNGSGIEPSELPRIFDPFYTTRAVGQGTGLGLCICHGAVSRMGGEITVRSEVGTGSTFRVDLPARAAPSPLPCGPSGGGRPKPAGASA